MKYFMLYSEIREKNEKIDPLISLKLSWSHKAWRVLEHLATHLRNLPRHGVKYFGKSL